jgi:hypothetical protein
MACVVELHGGGAVSQFTSASASRWLRVAATIVLVHLRRRANGVFIC